MSSLRQHFRPEFLNRIDETILFKPLQLEHIQRIVLLLLNDLNKTLEEKRIVVELTDEAVKWIAEKGFDPVYGARPLRRFMQRSIQTDLAKAIISGSIEEGSTARFAIENGRLQLAD